jgi:hypothetical protein
MDSILQILMERDGDTEAEAKEKIDDAREDLRKRLGEGEKDLDNSICMEHFGLEPDYIMELL